MLDINTSSFKSKFTKSIFLIALFYPGNAFANTYDCDDINKVPSSGSCAGKLIVNRQMLVDAITQGGANATNYSIFPKYHPLKLYLR